MTLGYIKKRTKKLCAVHFVMVAVAWGAVLIPQVGLAADLSATEILQRTAATYRKLQSYAFDVTVDKVRGQKVAEQHTTESGLLPGKYRFEDRDPKGEVTIGDGQVEWVTSRDSNQYTKNQITANTPTPISDFENIDQNVTEAEVAREELFIVDGKAVPVYVVMVTRSRWPQGTLAHTNFVAYRIDKDSFVVHKVITYAADVTQIALYSIAKWNQPVAETLFNVTPPESAHAVLSVKPRPTNATEIIGSEAPDFTLQDTSGHAVRLQDLRGKVVIVDFWATWCPPCRALMPHLQQMHRELSGKGLVILGLDVGEDAPNVSQFAMRESYTFPLLLGAEPGVSAKYFVEAYPTTFVIDREGRITFRGRASDSPKDLRAAVESALRRQ